MSEYRLNVLVVSRDRPILTNLCLNSIYENTKQFKEIEVCLFDNLSDPSIERMSMISKLLKENKIKYYSYDTKKSLTNCFGKAVAVRRWITMMEEDLEIRRKKGITRGDVDFYLLLDNDMILCPKWDEFFISSSMYFKTNQKDQHIHFLVKFPGGIPNAARTSDLGVWHTFTNQFKDSQKIEAFSAHIGGGSGCWFMNSKQISMIKMDLTDLLGTHNLFKRHDSITWAMIKKKLGNNTRYVAGVKPPTESPLVLHLGGVIGSICNSLMGVTREQYLSIDKSKFDKKEKELHKMTVSEIISRFKDSQSTTHW